MDLSGLNKILVALGRGDWAAQRFETVLANPWRLREFGDRGEIRDIVFEDQDAVCRWLLTRELVANPELAGDRPLDDEPDPSIYRAPHRRDEPPALRWRRPLSPHSMILDRDSGIAVVRDTSSVYAHGVDGAIYAVGLDVATGRRLWTEPANGRLNAHVLGDTVILAVDTQWTALDARTGERLWRMGIPPRAELLARHRGLVVVGSTNGGVTELGGLDLRTGQYMWRQEGPYSRTAFAYDGVPWLSRLLAVDARDGRLTLDAIRVRDGARDRLVDVPSPHGFHASEPIVLAEMLNDACDVGYVPVRGDAYDLLLIPGNPAAVPFSDKLFAFAVDFEHYCRRSSAARAELLSLVNLSGHVLWTLSNAHGKHLRQPGVTVVNSDDHVVAIGDDGIVRWRVPGHIGVIHDSVIWVGSGRDSAGYDAATGALLWSAVDLEAYQYPKRSRGFNPDDGHLLFERDGELIAFG